MEVKTIENYPRYAVSADGRVFGPTKELNGWLNSAGYKMVGISNDGGWKFVLVHRLIAEAFVDGKTDERNVVDHIDGDKLNNDASNLRWCTGAENTKYAFRLGLFPERQTMKPVILENLETGEKEYFESIHAAAQAYDLPYWHLNNIYHGRYYRKSTHGYTIYPA